MIDPYNSELGYGGLTIHVGNYGQTPVNFYKWRKLGISDLYPKSIFATEYEKHYEIDEFNHYICERENNIMSTIIKNLKSNTTIPESLKPGMMMSILQGNGIDEDYAVELFKKYLYQKGYVSDRHGQNQTQTQPRPKKIHVSNGVTTVIWDDNTKSQVRMQENEPTQDIEKGVAMAIAKKALGNNANWYDLFAVLRNLSEEGEYDISCTVPNEKELRKERKHLEKPEPDDEAAEEPDIFKLFRKACENASKMFSIPLERLMSDENAPATKGLKWDHADNPVIAKVDEITPTSEGCLVKACPLHRYLIEWNIEDVTGEFRAGKFKIRGTDHTDAFNRAVERVEHILATDNIDPLEMTVTQIND